MATTKDLIALLQSIDATGSYSVYIQGKEGGLEELSLENIVVSRVYRDVNSEEHSGYGAHEDANAMCSDSYDDENGNETPYVKELGLIICREN